METLRYGFFEYTVDHAVQGRDYIHGYDKAGNLVIAFEGIDDFQEFEYTGTFMAPEDCLEEACNDVKYVNGEFVRRDGSKINPNMTDEEGNVRLTGKLILSPDNYGDTLPETGEVGQLFFLKV